MATANLGESGFHFNCCKKNRNIEEKSGLFLVHVDGWVNADGL